MGVPLKVAASFAGIKYDTLHDWRNLGYVEIQRLETDPTPNPEMQKYVDFYRAVEAALETFALTGKPTLVEAPLTNELRERVCQALMIGCSPSIAARYGGISHDTYQLWQVIGATEIARMRTDPEALADKRLEPYVLFVQETQQAILSIAVAGQRVLFEAGIQKGSPDWALNLLTRLFPEDYVRQQPQQVNVTATSTQKHEGAVGVVQEIRHTVNDADAERLSAILGVLASSGALQSLFDHQTEGSDNSEADQIHSPSPDSETNGVPPMQ